MADVQSERDKRRVGENVRDLRVAAGMSQADLAVAMVERGQAHWRQTTVSRVERGIQAVDFEEWVALEEVLGGNVIKGTDVAYSIDASFGRLKTTIIVHRIGQVEARLQESIAETRVAMEELTALRRALQGGPDIGREEDVTLEYMGPEDVEHQEAR